MKNSIVFKFIAIILCAAFLLGAVGSIAGVVVLTEMDLYNKTVSQVREDRTASDAMEYANTLALMYTSSELGGCPERMVQNTMGGYYGFESTYPDYGYTIYDAEGNVLSTYKEGLKDTATVYTFEPTGQYMHLVSQESRSEIEAREVQEQIAAYTHDYGEDSSAVPAEGIVVHQVILLDSNGARIYEAYGDGRGSVNTTYFDDASCGFYFDDIGPAGFLFYNTNGELVYQSFLLEADVTLPETEVCEYLFVNDDEGFVLSNQDPNGVGIVSNTNGKLRFVSYFTQPAVVEPAEETVPETQPEEGWSIETIPGAEDRITVIAPDGTAMEVSLPQQEEPSATEETIEETASSETEADEETVEEETWIEETVPSSASAVPENTEVPENLENTEEAEETEAAETVTDPTLAETVPEETIPETTEPVIINGKPLADYQVNQTEYYDYEADEYMTAKYVYVPMPELTVELYVDNTTMRDAAAYDLLTLVCQYSNYLMPAIGICLFLLAVLAVYLCTAAGRKPKSEEVRAGGLNRLPLDLYLLGGGFAIALCIAFGVEGFRYLMNQNLMVACAAGVSLCFLACLIFVGFCFALVAQMKTPNGYWWRNSLCGRFIRLFMRFVQWLENWLSVKGFPALGRLIKKLWQLTVKSVIWLYHAFENSILWLGNKLGKAFHWMGRKIQRWFSLMPLTWQWTVIGMFQFCMLVIAFNTNSEFLTFVGIAIWFALILYGAHCFGTLLESTKKMAKGDLDTKVDDKLMVGSFKEFAGDLNDLADVAVVAAQKQLKSERMKTELITNVSHDIKTPLTSIINYVDLLQKPHTEEEEQQYLEVLDRQSQRLKKLIDDLMDMSKANTGNMPVDITKVDAVESVNQALGEFADKLDKAQLIPVFRHDDEQVPMMADGKLVWRVLSNLLGNAVKYAMPGTRLYLDLMVLEGKVILSLKNISREELNIDADELMERFVRGDDSRNTEGSGLGLNIAKSLMELQKGQFQLLVDGDLFKVTLIFPGA